MAYLGPSPARTPVTSDQITDASVVTAKLASPLVTPGIVDMNGAEFILDADGDTTIHSSTDDQIDIKIAGADDFKFSANTFNILSGSTLAIDSGATIANSGTSTGFGKLVGIKAATTVTVTSTTGTAYVDATNVTLDYAQAASGNYCLVTVTAPAWAYGTANQMRPHFQILRDAASISTASFNFIAAPGDGNFYQGASLSLQAYVSAGDTSSHTYKLQIKCQSSAASTSVGINLSVADTGTAVISIMEFAV
jgi:hypothetical protein